jgi:AraC-like DNA-binding protein
MPQLIRSAVLTGYVPVARAVGLEPYRLVQAAGLPASCLRDPDRKIPFGAVLHLLEDSARAAGIEDFGVRLAERRGLSNLGPIGLLVREQPTVRQAIEAYIRYGWLHAESIVLRLEEPGDVVILSVALLVARPVPVRQAQDLTVAMLYRVLKTLLGEAWRPQAVCLTHAAPRDLTSHHRVFGAPVEFGRDFNGLVCLARDLDRTIPGSDPVMARYIQRYVETLAAHRRVTLTDRVREHVAMTLGSGRCSREDVAAHLGLDRRTVHRRLAREGQTFSGIVDAVRTEMVTRFIENRDQPLYAVAEALGFSALSAFSRWFRARFGCSVSAWRAAHDGRARSRRVMAPRRRRPTGGHAVA